MKSWKVFSFCYHFHFNSTFQTITYSFYWQWENKYLTFSIYAWACTFNGANIRPNTTLASIHIDSLPHPKTNILIALLFYTVCCFLHPFRSLSLDYTSHWTLFFFFFLSPSFFVPCMRRFVVRIGCTIFSLSLSSSIIVDFLAHSTFIVFHLFLSPLTLFLFHINSYS